MRRVLSERVAALLSASALAVAAVALVFSAPPAGAATTLLGTELLGSNVMPIPTASVGGSVTVTIDDATNELCAYLDSDLETVTGMHIHSAPAGMNGPVLVNLPYEPHVSCVTLDPADTAEILANPGGHTFDLHTPTFPGGAVRGQLGPVAPTPEVELQAVLGGANVVPPSASTATGLASITVEDDLNRLCFDLTLDGLDIDDVTGIHVHNASAGTNGPINIQLLPGLAGCGEMGGDLLDQLLADPGAFYFDVHSATFPGGEIRGQLAAPPDPDPEPPVTTPTPDPIPDAEAPPGAPGTPGPGAAPAAQPVTGAPITFVG